jgi:hypothetical protein
LANNLFLCFTQYCKLAKDISIQKAVLAEFSSLLVSKSKCLFIIIIKNQSIISFLIIARKGQDVDLEKLAVNL